jgi:hypothetical protein
MSAILQIVFIIHSKTGIDGIPRDNFKDSYLLELFLILEKKNLQTF